MKGIWTRLLAGISIGAVLLLAGCASTEPNPKGNDNRSEGAATGEQHRVLKATYISDVGARMTAFFDTQAQTVTVTLPDGRRVSLPRAMSGSGARYSNDRETFWEHQGVGSFWIGEKLVFQGKVEPSK